MEDGRWVEVDVKVRYAETDAQGVVYHGSYVVWFEVGRTEYCEVAGYPYARMEAEGVNIVVSDLAARYRQPGSLRPHGPRGDPPRGHPEPRLHVRLPDPPPGRLPGRRGRNDPPFRGPGDRTALDRAGTDSHRAGRVREGLTGQDFGVPFGSFFRRDR
ncbi:MAG: hypothetical protein IPP07_24380 [Holophagales bacterium]|nr:hypothetical protein [Holophagales bacterium]